MWCHSGGEVGQLCRGTTLSIHLFVSDLSREFLLEQKNLFRLFLFIMLCTALFVPKNLAAPRNLSRDY